MTTTSKQRVNRLVKTENEQKDREDEPEKPLTGHNFARY
jgi:hypothetical protein